MRLKKIKQFLLDLFFPPFCVNCQKEGTYLCEDCFALLDFLPLVSPSLKYLDSIISPLPYNHLIAKKLIHRFKYFPYVKDLSKPLAFIIVHYLSSLDKEWSGEILEKGNVFAAVPLTKRKEKQRGFNQSFELAKQLSSVLGMPLVPKECLVKIRKTKDQIGLSARERKENVKGAFFCQKKNFVKGKKIILVDDVFTTGATMEECASVLKEAGAKRVFGITVARE